MIRELTDLISFQKSHCPETPVCWPRALTLGHAGFFYSQLFACLGLELQAAITTSGAASEAAGKGQSEDIPLCLPGLSCVHLLTGRTLSQRPFLSGQAL